MAVSGTYTKASFTILYKDMDDQSIYTSVEFNKDVDIDTFSSGSLTSNDVFRAYSISGSNDGTVTIFGYARKSSGTATATLTTRWYVYDSGVREYVFVQQGISITVVRTGSEPTVNITLVGSPQYYSGSPVSLVQSASVSPDCTLYLGLGDSTTTMPTSWKTNYRSLVANSDGTYYSWYKVTGGGIYLNKSETYFGSVSVSIQAVNPTVVVNGKTSLVYNGSQQSLISSASVSDGCTLYLSLSRTSGWTTDYSSIKATASGDYPIYYKVTSNSPYYNSVSATLATTVTIHEPGTIKIDPTVTISLSQNPMISSTITQAKLISYASVSSGCTLYIGLGSGPFSSPSTWYTDYNNVVASSAGTFFIWYKVTGNPAYNDISSTYLGSIEVKDASQTLLGEYPPDFRYVYNGDTNRFKFAVVDSNVRATLLYPGSNASVSVTQSYGRSVIDFNLSNTKTNYSYPYTPILSIRHQTSTNSKTISARMDTESNFPSSLTITGEVNVVEGQTYTYSNKVYVNAKNQYYKYAKIFWSISGEAANDVMMDSSLSSDVNLTFPIGSAGKQLTLHAICLGSTPSDSYWVEDPVSYVNPCYREITITIGRAVEEVTIPTWKGNVPYTGSAISVNSDTYWNNYPYEGVTVTGFTGTNAGTYSATFTCSDGYEFSDGTTEKTISWGISKATNRLIITSPLNQEWVSGSTYDPIRYVKESGTTFPLIVSSTFGSIIYSSSSVNASVTSGGVVTSQDRDGIAVITLSVEGTNNYYGVSGQIQFEFQNNPVTQIMYQHHWNTAEAYVYLDGLWRKAIPYIWYDGSWRKC